MKTRITELYGIKYPIICGGMLWLGEPKLCAAISEAGGLGVITAANYNDAEDLRAAIKQVRALTNKPMGVNITLLPSFRITEQMYDDYFRVCCEEKITHIEIAGNFATKYINQVHDAGIKIAHKVGALRHAKKIEQLGYDAVIAAGIEEGGHPLNDDVTTMLLTPRIAESLSIPVITAGGITDGRGLAAALCLGGEGILMATRFVASDECMAHEAVKEEIVKRQECDTTLICKTTGLQARALKNGLTQEILSIENGGGTLEDLRPLITGQRLKDGVASGTIDSFALMVGQSVGLIEDIKPCKEIMDTMISDAEAILKKKVAYFSVEGETV
jgi:NADH:quinone reductase (non-electrogenic)